MQIIRMFSALFQKHGKITKRNSFRNLCAHNKSLLFLGNLLLCNVQSFELCGSLESVQPRFVCYTRIKQARKYLDYSIMLTGFFSTCHNFLLPSLICQTINVIAYLAYPSNLSVFLNATHFQSSIYKNYIEEFPIMLNKSSECLHCTFIVNRKENKHSDLIIFHFDDVGKFEADGMSLVTCIVSKYT